MYAGTQRIFAFIAAYRDLRLPATGLESDTGDRIRACFEHVGDRFFATYGDGLGNVDIHALLNFHKAQGGMATVTAVPSMGRYSSMR